MAPSKVEGPATSLTFLGIQLDTERMEIRLPADKLARLQALIWRWREKKACIKRDLLSLIGHLQQASRVIPSGRSFLRRMIDVSKSVPELHHHIRLNDPIANGGSNFYIGGMGCV